jgi:hypothetical protein
MKVGDLVKYVGRDGSMYCGIVLEYSYNGTALALLNNQRTPLWFGPGTLEVISENR